MASDESYVEFVRDQSRLGTALVSKKMFGEYALYLDGRIVALVCDNQLYLKRTDAGRPLLRNATEQSPFPQAKPYFRLDAELDDPPLLQRLLLLTADALPLPAPKRPKGAKKAKTAKAPRAAKRPSSAR